MTKQAAVLSETPLRHGGAVRMVGHRDTAQPANERTQP